MRLPKITIMIITLNNGRTLNECLERIAGQDYPKGLIEYLNIDAGSTDLTRAILNKYGYKIISSPVGKNAEAQRAVGVKEASNNLIVSLDADNYLPDNQWLKQMILPFTENKNVIYSGTLHYSYNKNDSLFNRYCALFGVVDPTVYYIGKPDRVPFYKEKWTTGRIISSNKNYSVVKFNKHDLPTVGCNGVVYKRDIILKYAKSDPKNFIHIDIFVDLILKGYDNFAVVNNSVIHDTAVTLKRLIQKRMAFLTNYNLGNSSGRRYYIYNPNSIKDRIRLLIFIIYTITFIKPLIDSVYGFIKIRDRAWFIHPFMCWVYLYSYGLASIREILKK